jgi:hypothetical protein
MVMQWQVQFLSTKKQHYSLIRQQTIIKISLNFLQLYLNHLTVFWRIDLCPVDTRLTSNVQTVTTQVAQTVCSLLHL